MKMERNTLYFPIKSLKSNFNKKISNISLFSNDIPILINFSTPNAC